MEKKHRITSKWYFWLMPITGFFALMWFLVRVIPKPSRATYPCQRVAFPIASSFVIWLFGLAGTAAAAKRAQFLLKSGRVLGAVFFLGVAFMAISIPVSHNCPLSFGGDGSWYVPADAPLTPIGTGRGIFPGRVVWNYDPDATSWDGATGKWWDSIDQARVDQMLSDTIIDMTEAAYDAQAWDRIFRYHNQSKGYGDVGYQAGEKIVIKLNLNKAQQHDYDENGTFIAPQVVLALARQLVYQAGVDADCITFFDASRCVPDPIFNPCKAEFPDLHFADFYGGDGREQVQKDMTAQIHWSDDLQNPTEVGGGSPAYIPTCITGADYFINLASLKGHSLAGITVCAKNHFGSFLADAQPGGTPIQVPKNAGVHPYIAVHDFNIGNALWECYQRPMGTYNALVDLMGHEQLGGKTILYLVDGLFAANAQGYVLSANCKWQSKPFCDDDGWPSSLLASQDPVAIDSVALDFIRSEPTIQEYSNVINAGDTVDNFLHEAAQADAPPSNAFYDPEGDFIAMDSLGVHEHWNNPFKRQYTGNLKTNDGIELVRSPRLPGDINSGGVDCEDLVLLIANWNATGCDESNNWRNGADINKDGSVNLKDYAHICSAWRENIIE